MKKILKSIINFYNTWYGVINAIIALFIVTSIDNTALMIMFIALALVDAFSWYKNVFKNFGTKKELFGSVSQNNALCIYGGIGAGKSTMAEYIMNHFIPAEKRYYNTKRVGFKAVEFDHLLLKKKFEDGCGVFIDEAGGMADAYHYSKNDNPVRKRLDYLNKYFRHWYTDKSLLLYIDQCQGNMNTSLYKNIYYVIQCKSCTARPSAFVPHFICKIVLFFVNKYRENKFKKTKNKKYEFPYNNPFSNVCLEYMEFSKLGDYADHYVVNIEDKDHKKLVGSIYTFFTGQNTYVFREYNPAKSIPSYVWGTNKEKDIKIMNDNFNFETISKDIRNTLQE